MADRSNCPNCQNPSWIEAYNQKDYFFGIFGIFEPIGQGF